MSPSAVSHTIRALEESLGVRLLPRTTRNVAPTEAGRELLVRLRPAFTDIEDALDKLPGLRDKPVGRVRLVTPRLAAMMVLAPRLKNLGQDYPDVVLDVTTDESFGYRRGRRLWDRLPTSSPIRSRRRRAT